MTAAALSRALARAETDSPFLRKLIGRHDDLAAQLAAGDLDGALHAAKVIDTDLPIPTALRIAKARLALTLAIGDLAGALSLEAVVKELSAFADTALDLAIRDAIEALMPGAEAQGFAAIALGKHGSCELNYSSDIDPILIFDPETLPRRQRDEPVEAAVRIATRMMQTMQSRDGDGYVFRVICGSGPIPK